MGQCVFFYPILLFPEFRENFVWKLYAAATVKYLSSFPVEPDVPLPQDACLIILPFGCCRVLTLCNQLSNVCAQVGVLFLVNLEH